MIRTSKKRKIAAFSEIFLLISLSFAVAFIISEAGVVSATPVFSAPARTFDNNASIPIGPEGGAGITGSAVAIIFGTIAIFSYNAETGVYLSTLGLRTLTTGLFYAAIWAGVGFLVGRALGLSAGEVQRLTVSAGIGGAVFGAISGFGGTVSWAAAGWGAAALVAVYLVLKYTSDQEARPVTFECLPWEAPLGGADCSKCNQDPESCTEYRCKSLGQACEIVNEGSKSQACVFVSRNDIKAPEITPAPGLLSPSELSYTNHDTKPPSLGVKIVDSRTSTGCLKAFTPLQFGLNTNEPAKCSWSIAHTDNITEMTDGFDERVYKTLNHTLTFVLPNNESGVDLSPVIESDGTFNYFVRCEDYSGNGGDAAEYAVSFCIDDAPDLEEPKVQGTSINTGSPVAFGIDELEDFQIYTDKPAECRWSRNDQDFDTMENTMNCPLDATQISANLRYTCSGTLTGFQNNIDNDYYFRCRDFAGNTMVQSEKVTLIGSQPLNILSAGPNKTITGSASTVLVDLEVETDDGAEQGKAVCSYRSPTGITSDYITMLETDNHLHKQPNLNLGAGTYEFEFKCRDIANNFATTSVTFDVLVDKDSPDVTRAYKQGDFLKIITNEDAECVYNTQSCNYEFEDGLPMSHSTPDDQNIQIVQWKTGANFYIKCQDELLNRPSPNECSIIVKTVN